MPPRMDDCLKASKEYLHINKGLIRAKVFCFAFFSGHVALVSYFTIHAKWLGLTKSQIGVIYTIIPIVQIAGPPVFAPIADRFRIHRSMLLLFLVASILLSNSMLLIPRFKRDPFEPDYILVYGPSSNQSQLSEIKLVPTWTQPNNSQRTAVLCAMLPKSFNVTLRTVVHQMGVKNDSLPSTLYGCSYEASYQPTDGYIKERRGVFPRSYILNLSSLNESEPSCSFAENVYVDANYTVQLQYDHHSYATDSDISGSESPLCVRTTGDATKTYALYFVIRVLTSFAMGTSYILIDAIVLAIIKDRKGDYGMQRLWQVIGVALGVPFTGAAMDITRDTTGSVTYMPVFIVFAVGMTVAGVVIAATKVPTNIRSEASGTSFGNVLRYPSVIVFGIALFLLGILFGNLEAFIFVYFEMLGATGMEMGLSVTVGCLTSMPFIFVSKALFRYAGEISIIIAAFYAYAIRFFGYSIIYHMRWVYFFEAMESLTSALMWVATITYAARLTPPGLYATTLTIIAGLHYGAGKGIGGYLGGMLWEWYGMRRSYQIMALSAVISGTLYTIIHLAWLRKAVNYDTAVSQGDEKGQDDDATCEELAPLGQSV